MSAPELTRTHRILIGVVVAGAVVIAAIGFAGSYAAVRDLAEKKGFGAFSAFFPIGIDAGIVVLLALDLLLTWIRIPFPLLRQTAWLLTAATIAFNGAAAWPDPLGVGMHAVIPVLFVVAVEAARHAVGRIADITADKHMEGVRVSRWLLAFPSTFRLWRRMKLWELRSYDEVIRLEQDRLVYQARLRARYGRAWRRKAPVESMMPLRLARYGVPLSETGPDGLAAAGIEPALLPAGTAQDRRALPSGRTTAVPDTAAAPQDARPRAPYAAPGAPGGAADGSWQPPGPGAPPETRPPAEAPQAPPQQAQQPLQQPPEPAPAPEPAYAPQAPAPAYAAETVDTGQVTVPVGPNRRRTLGNAHPTPVPQQRLADYEQPVPAPDAVEAETDELGAAPGLPDDVPLEDAYYGAFRRYINEHADYPNARQFALYLMDHYGVRGRTGGPLSESTLRPYIREFKHRYSADMDAEHIA